MCFIPFGKWWVRHLSLKTDRDAAKIREEVPHLNNSKSFWKNYAHTFQSAKNYLFRCSNFHLDWIVVSGNEDKTVNPSRIFMHPEQQDLPYTDSLFVPLHTGLLEKWDLQMISVLKLILQTTTAESLIAAGAQRMDQNFTEHFLTCWRK